MDHRAAPRTMIAHRAAPRKGFVAHPHKALLDKALRYVREVESVRAKARELDVEPSTLKRWIDAGSAVRVPFSEANAERLRTFVARREAEGKDGAQRAPEVPHAAPERLRLIRLLADPSVTDEEAAAAMIQEASRILGKRL